MWEKTGILLLTVLFRCVLMKNDELDRRNEVRMTAGFGRDVIIFGNGPDTLHRDIDLRLILVAHHGLWVVGSSRYFICRDSISSVHQRLPTKAVDHDRSTKRNDNVCSRCTTRLLVLTTRK